MELLITPEVLTNTFVLEDVGVAFSLAANAERAVAVLLR